MQTEHIKVTGMTCDGCIPKVTSALKAVSGVSDVKVSLSNGEAIVQFDEQKASLEQFESALQNAGYNKTNAKNSSETTPSKSCCG